MPEKKAIADVIRAQATGLGNMEALLIQQSTELARAKAELLKQAKAIEDLEDESLPPPLPPDDDLFLGIEGRLWSIDKRSEVGERPDQPGIARISDPYTGAAVATAPTGDVPSTIGHVPADSIVEDGRWAIEGFGGWLVGPPAVGTGTLVVVAQWGKQPGSYAKLAGADSKQSERGGFCLGRMQNGDLEAWADDGITFAAARAPLREDVPVLHVVRFGINSLLLYVDGHERTVEYDQEILPFSGPVTLLAGWWRHHVVDAANVAIFAAHAFDRLLTDAEVDSIIEHYRELAPPAPDEPVEPPPPPPPGPHPDEIPPASGPTIEVRTAADVNNAPRDANLIFRPGTYKLSNVRARHGQVWRAPDGAAIDGGSARFLINATGSRAAEGVAMVGFTVTNFDASPGGLNDKHRMNDETGTIHLEHDICRDWKFRDISFVTLGKAAVRISGRIDMRRVLLEDVEGAAISGHTYDAIFEDITGRRINQKRRAHTHHHSGLIKLTGGQQADHDGPPRQNILLRRVQAFDVYGRGLCWTDWNVRRVTIEDCLVDGTEKEGITLEAMECGIIRRCVIKGRKKKHNTPSEWNAAIMLQNARGCIVEDCEIFNAPGLDAAVAVAHHNRHNMSGPMIGRFTGTDNVFRNSRVQNGIQHVLYQGVVDVAPGRATVLASNKAHGITRF